jgi:hypothetical protein
VGDLGKGGEWESNVNTFESKTSLLQAVDRETKYTRKGNGMWRIYFQSLGFRNPYKRKTILEQTSPKSL